MEYVYDILIDGEVIEKGLSENDFFDMMDDLAEGFYTKEGSPGPGNVSHVMYQKE
jgi:hypothetical protein